MPMPKPVPRMMGRLLRLKNNKLKTDPITSPPPKIKGNPGNYVIYETIIYRFNPQTSLDERVREALVDLAPVLVLTEGLQLLVAAHF